MRKTEDYLLLLKKAPGHVCTSLHIHVRYTAAVPVWAQPVQSMSRFQWWRVSGCISVEWSFMDSHHKWARHPPRCKTSRESSPSEHSLWPSCMINLLDQADAPWALKKIHWQPARCVFNKPTRLPLYGVLCTWFDKVGTENRSSDCRWNIELFNTHFNEKIALKAALRSVSNDTWLGWGKRSFLGFN